MAKNFLDQEEKATGINFRDGFVFGFGFFLAQLLGLSILAGLVMAVQALVR